MSTSDCQTVQYRKPENTSEYDVRRLANRMLEKIGVTRTDAYNAWYFQRRHANRRGIPFHFTQDEWTLWWGEDLPKRGRGDGKLCMCRLGDEGPYTWDNVYKATNNVNSQHTKVNGHHRAKPATLSAEDVSGIKEMLSQGVPQRKIARLYGTSQRTVNRINLDKYRLHD